MKNLFIVYSPQKDKLLAQEKWWAWHNDSVEVLQILHGQSWLVWNSQKKSSRGNFDFMCC